MQFDDPYFAEVTGEELIIKGFVPMRSTAMVLRQFYTLVKELL